MNSRNHRPGSTERAERGSRRGDEARWATVGFAAAAAFIMALTAGGPLRQAGAEPPENATDAQKVLEEASEALDAAAGWLSGTVQELTERVQAEIEAAPAPTGVRVARLAEVGAAAEGEESGTAAIMDGDGTTGGDATAACDGTEDGVAVLQVVWDAAANIEGPLPEHLVLLVHGLDEPGPIWDEMTPALLAAGLDVARFDYPNDQRVADSTDLMAEALRALAARGVKRVDIVGHSMGGLVARDVLTRDAHYGGDAEAHNGLPDIGRLITIGTPHEGSAWAQLQLLSETREQFARWIDSGGADLGALLDFSQDGSGEAAEDLKPGSAFLVGLNARPRAEGVEITCIRATIAPEEASVLMEVLDWPVARQFLTAEQIADLEEGGEELLASLGDGVVPRDSAVLEGAEVVDVEGNHRSVLLRGFLNDARRAVGKEEKVAPAIPVVLERLVKDETE